MSSQKHGYIIIDCNTTSLDLQPILFLLEYSSVLCVTLTGNTEVSLTAAYNETLRILSMIGRFDIPVVRRTSSGIPAPAHCLAHICEKFPHKVTVVCLGPLSNVAVALQLNRTFERNVKRVVCASDGFNGRQIVSSWNFKTDIEATRQVFTSRIPVVLLPSNVTCSVSVTSYLNSREGTNGLFSTLFDCNDDFLFKASMKRNPSGVNLQKVAAALVAMKPNLILKKRMINFRDQIDKSYNGSSDTSNSESYPTLSNNRSSLTVSHPTLSSQPVDSFSSDILHGISRTGNNVVMIEKIDVNGLLKFYKHIYLIGSKNRTKFIS